MPALERWTNLESLNLDHCGLLTHLTLSLPRLRSISLRHCRALATVRHPRCSLYRCRSQFSENFAMRSYG